MRGGVLLEVEVVEEPGDEPEIDGLAQVRGIAFERGGDHERVRALVGVADMGVEEGGGGFAGGEGHGANGKRPGRAVSTRCGAAGVVRGSGGGASDRISPKGGKLPNRKRRARLDCPETTRRPAMIDHGANQPPLAVGRW